MHIWHAQLNGAKFCPAHKGKMPTMVGILTFINRINATAERFNAKKKSERFSSKVLMSS